LITSPDYDTYIVVCKHLLFSYEHEPHQPQSLERRDWPEHAELVRGS